MLLETKGPSAKVIKNVEKGTAPLFHMTLSHHTQNSCGQYDTKSAWERIIEIHVCGVGT
jgi:hypothetical protein